MSALSIAAPFIKGWEQCRLRAYPDPGTGAEPWTIGWAATGAGIGPGTVWTQEQADNRFLVDIARFERGVRALVKVPLADPQWAALISLAYNIGLGAFGASTLLRMVNAGDLAGAADQFIRWNRSGGRVLLGLTRRRTAERDLFNGHR